MSYGINAVNLIRHTPVRHVLGIARASRRRASPHPHDAHDMVVMNLHVDSGLCPFPQSSASKPAVRHVSSLIFSRLSVVRESDAADTIVCSLFISSLPDCAMSLPPSDGVMDAVVFLSRVFSIPHGRRPRIRDGTALPHERSALHSRINGRHVALLITRLIRAMPMIVIGEFSASFFSS